jgi:hypothetical protein
LNFGGFIAAQIVGIVWGSIVQLKKWMMKKKIAYEDTNGWNYMLGNSSYVLQLKISQV